jgi:hypothetical protein
MTVTRAAHRRPLRVVVALVAGLVLLPVPQAFASGPHIAAGPTGLGAGTGSRATADANASGPFRINLAKDGDYVRQYTFVQCVGASVQMMLNMTEPGANGTRRFQHRLQDYARDNSGPRADGGVRQGAGVFGWAAALNKWDAGPYEVVGADSLQQAMRMAARAIVTTKRPVGLLVWKGRHAWVMSGFEATGDPRDGSFRVTRANILDPLYPHGSEYWGKSPTPGTSISVRDVGRQFVHRDVHSDWNSLPWMKDLAGKWVLVLPVEPDVDTVDDATGDPPEVPEPAIAAPLPPRAPDRSRNF